MFKAFDKVWLEVLAFKLKQNNIPGSLLKISTKFLDGRKQRLVLNTLLLSTPVGTARLTRENIKFSKVFWGEA